MMKKRKLLLAAVAFIMVFTLAACGNSSSGGNTGASTLPSGSASDGEPERGGTLNLVYGDTAEPFGLPWQTVMGFGSQATVANESLIQQRVDGSYEMCLATDYTIDTDKKEIRFTLREGVKFHDGSDFNADVVVWNWTKWTEANRLYSAITGFEKRGEYEVAMFFDEYDPCILAEMGTHTYGFISQENYEKNGEEYAMQNIVGTGPFKQVSYTPGGEVVFERFEGYWKGTENTYLDKITFQRITDEMQQVNAVRATGSEGLDILRSSTAETVAQCRDSGAPVHVIDVPLGVVSMFPSSANPDSPLAKLEVRQAISAAVDRESLVNAFGYGLYSAAYQYIALGFKGRVDEADGVPHYDPERAKQLLADAGYPNGFKMTIVCEYGFAGQDFIVALAEQLKAVGIESDLEFPTQAASNEYRMNGGYEGVLVGRLTSFPSPSRMFYLMSFNPTSYQFYAGVWRPDDQEALDLYKKVSTDVDESDELAQQYHKLLIKNCVDIPLYYTGEYWVVKDNTHGGTFGEWASGQDWLPETVWKEQ
jgi:peptide/nickel transport system substrate-binding protein